MLKKAKDHLILGDIVISIEKIISEAEQQKKIFWDHLSHMLIHSILHLLGYDHENKNDAIMMENKERDIFTKLSEEKII